MEAESPMPSTQESTAEVSQINPLVEAIRNRVDALSQRMFRSVPTSRLGAMFAVGTALLLPAVAGAQENKSPDMGSSTHETAILHASQSQDRYGEALSHTFVNFFKIEGATLPANASPMHRIAFTRRHASQLMEDYSRELDALEVRDNVLPLNPNREFAKDNAALEKGVAIALETAIGNRVHMDLRHNPDAFSKALAMSAEKNIDVRTDCMSDYPELYAALTEVRHEHPGFEDAYAKDLKEVIAFMDSGPNQELDQKQGSANE